MSFHGEAETMADFIFQLFNLLTVKFDNFFTILADDVVVIGMIGVVGIVNFAVFSKIHFVDQATFRQQRQGSVNRRPGNGFVSFARPFQQLFRREVLFGIENRIDDRLSLRSDSQTFSAQKVHEFLFSGRFFRCCHEKKIYSSGRPSQRACRQR